MKYLLPTEIFLQLIEQELAHPATGKACRKNYLGKAVAASPSKRAAPYKRSGLKRPSGKPG